MKKILPLLFLSLTIPFTNSVFAQKDFGIAKAVVKYLTGDWRWLYSHGGFFGATYDSTYTGTTEHYSFSPVEGASDSVSYIYYINGSVEKSGKAKIWFPDDNYSLLNWAFDYLPGDNWGSWLGANLIIDYISKDTLTFMEHAKDGFNHWYARTTPLSITNFELPQQTGKVIPNPCQNSFRVGFGGQPGFDYLRLSNLGGQTVKELANGSGEVDVSGVVPGIYILNATKGSQQIRVKLIIR